MRIVLSCACLGDERTVILEPPLSTGAGGRSPEKTSPGMVDRPSKRQGPGPGCGEVEDGVLAWHGGLDRPSVRTRPGDDRAGRTLRPSAGEKVIRSLGSTPTPCSSSLSSETLGATVACEATGVFRQASACPSLSPGWRHAARLEGWLRHSRQAKCRAGIQPQHGAYVWTVEDGRRSRWLARGNDR